MFGSSCILLQLLCFQSMSMFLCCLDKLKNLKAAIKQWSKVDGNIDVKKIFSIQQKVNEVEDLPSHRILSDQELKDRNSLQQELWNASNAFESLLRQKSRAKWLKEGDCNTGYFHKIINFRRAFNAIPGIFIDGGVCGGLPSNAFLFQALLGQL